MRSHMGLSRSTFAWRVALATLPIGQRELRESDRSVNLHHGYRADRLGQCRPGPFGRQLTGPLAVTGVPWHEARPPIIKSRCVFLGTRISCRIPSVIWPLIQA